MRVVLPFKLVGQKLVKGRDFPKSVADGSKDSIVIKVGGIPEGCVAKGYFKLSWESNTTYDLTFNGDELVVDEYIVTLPAHANNKYIDYKFSFSVAIWEGDVERLTTNPVEIVVEKSNYTDETTNTPDMPEDQYNEVLLDLAEAKSLANTAGANAAMVDERITHVVIPRIEKLEDGGGLPNTTAEDNDKILTVVNGEPQWALHAGISNKQKVVFADDGEGNVSIVLVDGDEEGGELEERVEKVEATLYGAEEKPPVETVSVTNLVTNSQFDSDMTGWSLQYNGEYCTAEVVDGVLTVNFTGANEHIRQRFGTQDDIIKDHKYYMYARCKFEGGNPVTTNAVSKIHFTGNGASYVVDEDVVHPTLGDWGYTSKTLTVTDTNESGRYFGIWLQYANSSAGNGSVVRIDCVAVIDLTASFGAGSEPDRATMDKWMQEQYPYGFDGTATLYLTTDEDDGEDGGLVGKVEALDDAVDKLAEDIKNLPISDLVQTGTVYPVLEDYYITNIEEARPEYYNAQEVGALTFTMMSDMHSTPYDPPYDPTPTIKNIEASSAWAKLVNNDFVMISGDVISDVWDKPTALSVIDNVFELTEKHARCPVYAVKGNHDTNEGAGEAVDRISDKEFYRHANARGDKHGMVVDPAHPYSGYYYVDFPKQKIRMVCLNTSEDNTNYDILGASSSFRYVGVKSPNQMAWIKDTALRVDEGWAVMMVSHIAPFQAENFYNRGTDNPALRALCEAFAAGTGDFAEQGAREFIGHFSGHAHIDAYNEVGGLNYVLVNSTTPHKRWDTAADREFAGEKALSLNSFIVDRATRTVKCIKIGSAPSPDHDGWVDSFTWNEVSV